MAIYMYMAVDTSNEEWLEACKQIAEWGLLAGKPIDVGNDKP